MKRISVKALVPGMRTAEDVYSYDKQLILPRGIKLSDRSITRLEFYSVVSVKVEDDELSANVAELQVNEAPSYSERVQSSKEFQAFTAQFGESVTEFKGSLNDIVANNADIDTDALLHHTVDLLNSDAGKSINIFTIIQNMRSFDDQTFTHSMNVALICHVFAGWLHFSEEDIKLATLCGLLHDIGKLKIPDDLLSKTDKLTDEEYKLIKTHTTEGYDILKKQGLDEHICNAALMHHERCDGTGYPNGLTADQIDKFAKLVAIADVYDAMTSARVYRGPLCPFKAIDLFVSEGLQRYDTQYYLTFVTNIVNSYLRNRVRLSNGMEGEIVYVNSNDLARPMIQCGEKFIDLSKEKNISIDAII